MAYLPQKKTWVILLYNRSDFKENSFYIVEDSLELVGKLATRLAREVGYWWSVKSIRYDGLGITVPKK